MTKKSAIVLGVAGLFVGVLAGSYIALPNIAERVSQAAIAKVGQRLGVQLTVVFQYTRDSRVEWQGIEVFTGGETGGAKVAAARIDSVQLDFDPSSIFTGRLRLKELAISGFDVQVVRGSTGDLNFKEVIERLRGNAPKQAVRSHKVLGVLASEQMGISLPEVRFSDGTVTFAMK